MSRDTQIKKRQGRIENVPNLDAPRRRQRAKSVYLFLLDQRCFDALVPGVPPAIPYSHDKNLLMYAHEALRAGHAVFFSRTLDQARRGAVCKVETVYPIYSHSESTKAPDGYDVVCSAGIEHLSVRQDFPGAKIVGVVPALHMIETPLAYGGEQPIAWINALRYHVDFIVTQNARMRDIIVTLCQWLARWDPSDRVIVAPLGYAPEALTSPSRSSARQALGIKDDSVLIANAGGAWSWTDCDTVVSAFIKYAKRHDTRIRLYFPGLRQADNTDLNPVADRIEGLKKRHPEMFGEKLRENKPICIETSWSDAGRRLPQVLEAADIGLSVSKKSFESWQSHRVRFVDYLQIELPVLCTSESLLAEEISGAALKVEGGDEASYQKIFKELDNSVEYLESARNEVLIRREFLRSDVSYANVVRTVEQMDRRVIHHLPPSVLDAEREQIVSQIRSEVGSAFDRKFKI